MSKLKSSLAITGEKGVDINKGMIGLFFEDINYGADGGLYAELLENPNFEFLDSRGDKDAYYQKFDGLYGWKAYPEGTAVLSITEESPISKTNPHYLTVTTNGEKQGFTNRAFDGVTLKKGVEYILTFYARGKAYQGNIEAQIKGQGKVYASALTTGGVQGEWTQYSLTLMSEEDVRNGEFIVCLTEAGKAEFDFFSLMPSDAVLGLFRADLVQFLKDITPGFLRFPGGCIVEGNELSNRYQWKESVGPRIHRRNNWNRWAVHENNQENDFTSIYSHYNQTLGLGYYEYFLLSEYLGAKAIPIQNVGLACQYQSTQKVASDSDEFNEFIQDALDLIEFANGDADTKWGNLRAEMGHKEPFNLEYLGIGNEQWETSEVDYFHRYECFEKEIHKYYPDIKLVSSAGPNVNTDTYNAAWKWVREKAEENSNFTAVIDEHYYMPPKWFLENDDFYDEYPRTVKVFAGEYAAHLGNGMNRPEVSTMEAALAEAAFMTGLERNGDVVSLAAYAPLFARINYTQWSPDLIWFDDQKAYGTPSYYVQKLYGNHMGNRTLKFEKGGDWEALYATVCYDDETGEHIIKLVNTGSEARETEVALQAVNSAKQEASAVILSAAALSDRNTIEEPDKVVPVSVVLPVDNGTVRLDLKPYSLTVIRL
ncbi:alpha-L-arabinofuranosidase C-terminal domain-containing protein [Anaerocolumna sp. AGMB13020]|uniref:alpha-L-arabinofuranosidase C-terminal domain-containing protein n=1 Tax=Anaerocolumna sp. AGMB13020 TaxID=3081750 RepID=UPI002954F524|nr:alpha-L-arabinofuranosidase C-terminal domain-containing protein [Anaerocolumna sp. AGMB13020]WOO36177.1 alpha-L-arabinofuranosidase C-terminal domain-containing protein [Anaerocolumna sp. AGMB13020]